MPGKMSRFGDTDALRYVLHNARHHGRAYTGVDLFSSGPWFTGWIDHTPFTNPSPIARATSWLLTIGWKRAGGALPVTCAPA